MKKVTVLVIAAIILSTMVISGYASDYQGNEKEESIFQKLGDFITGKYEVNGKPLKEKGVLQAVADQVKDIEPAPVR